MAAVSVTTSCRIVAAAACPLMPSCTSSATFPQCNHHPTLTTKECWLNFGLQRTWVTLSLKGTVKLPPSFHLYQSAAAAAVAERMRNNCQSANYALEKMRQLLLQTCTFVNWSEFLHLCSSSPASSVVDGHCKQRFLVIRRRSMIVLLMLARERINASAAEDGQKRRISLPTLGGRMFSFAELNPNLELEPFTDKEEGFQLLKPANWSKVSKAGATVLFEDPEAKSNNLGVVINPVRISSLREFGSPQDVARKLIEAEQKKSSTNAASLIAIKERLMSDNIPLYEYEYKLDSSRGMKRVFGAVTIASKKLYILNVAYMDSPEMSLSPSISQKLQAIVASFDVLH
ncbi:hypothetical protein O6H91_18G026900 [Diphasiastrum complanatum]|uniref:Uncharacterized protein n=1 Tax=Diphasiastrum complanatum TaxID=34168 RepID=A0ACC2AZ71_DIPCM|nr:hypothetical protein O6H91_18G026900 [Diphasiastrum complanatum]